MIKSSLVESNRVRFTHFPGPSFLCQTTDPKESLAWVCLGIEDVPTQKTLSVWIKESDLREEGISVSTLRNLQGTPERLPEFFEISHATGQRLGKIAVVAKQYLNPENLEFFISNRSYAIRLILGSIYRRTEHPSKTKNVPGMYFDFKGSSLQVFINVKGSRPLGSGTFGKVRLAIWLTAPNQDLVLAAKKTLREPEKFTTSKNAHFDREITTLREFSGEIGIISLIAGGVFGNKRAIFLPKYECNVTTYLTAPRFSLTMDQILSAIGQWLEGLATISKKGVHGDISPNNLLLKKTKEGGVKAVISDFGSFRKFGEEEHGITTIPVGSPEYFAKQSVTGKLDVWSLGMSLHAMVSKESLPHWEFTGTACQEWISRLNPNWSLKSEARSDTPRFLLDLINAMLDPEPKDRLSAEEALNLFKTYCS